jgi:hypothetical protein
LRRLPAELCCFGAGFRRLPAGLCRLGARVWRFGVRFGGLGVRLRCLGAWIWYAGGVRFVAVRGKPLEPSETVKQPEAGLLKRAEALW